MSSDNPNISPPDANPARDEEKEARREEERAEILRAVANVELTTVQRRVAWLLNHSPETRDSDITLQLEYWREFASDIYQGGAIQPEDLYKLPRLTSLARARATIQNSHGLFLASEHVRRHRGTLQEEEREIQRDAAVAANRKSFSVFTDESGKTGEHLIVGSCWLLNGIESRRITQAIDQWRDTTGFTDELHFSRIGRGSIHRYMEALNILEECAAALSFKAISLPRSGIRDVDTVLGDMLYHLLVRGIQHEHESGRAPLPRIFQLWKDREEEARDALSLANLKDRLTQTAQVQFDKSLVVGEMFAMDSASNLFLQFADLFVSSTNRILTSPDADQSHPKDMFAQSFLARFGVRRVAGNLETTGDVVMFEDV